MSIKKTAPKCPGAVFFSTPMPINVKRISAMNSRGQGYSQLQILNQVFSGEIGISDGDRVARAQEIAVLEEFSQAPYAAAQQLPRAGIPDYSRVQALVTRQAGT
jgi:hypothetical protein